MIGGLPVGIGPGSSPQAMISANTAIRSVRYGLLEGAPRGAGLHMIDWDDISLTFFAVSRGGSVRAAAKSLGCEPRDRACDASPSLRNVLGAHVRKAACGLPLTAAGEEVLELAKQMKRRRLNWRRASWSRPEACATSAGDIGADLATHLLMPDLADFARLHPDIEMEILASGELANLTNREADVAIRVVYDRKTLPLNLHGLKGPELFGGVYISCDRLAAWRAGARRIPSGGSS